MVRGSSSIEIRTRFLGNLEEGAHEEVGWLAGAKEESGNHLQATWNSARRVDLGVLSKRVTNQGKGKNLSPAPSAAASACMTLQYDKGVCILYKKYLST